MKVIILISLSLLSLQSAYSNENLKLKAKRNASSLRKNKLNEIIEKEFTVLRKVNEIKGGRDPRVLYRLLELYSEKIKLTKEKENQAFLSKNADSEKTVTNNPDIIFKESKKLYKEAFKLGIKIIKRFPEFKDLAGVYYALALNSRDFETGKVTERYLKFAIKYGSLSGNKKLLHNTYASLADYYYNEKKFKKAIPFYKRVINNKKDDWNTKYTFNLSWCYLKAKKHSLAIDTMKSAFYKSKNPDYINISEQVLGHIGLFYALGKRVQDGIQFYIKNTEAPVKYLIKMGNLLKQRGLFELAKNTFDQSLALAKNDQERFNVYDAMMGLFGESKNIVEHFRASMNLFKLALKVDREPIGKVKDKVHPLINDSSVEDLTIRLTNFVGFIQKGFANKTLRLSKKMEDKFANIVIKYFELLSFLDYQNSSKYSFFIAETHYSVGNKEKALITFQSSYKEAVREKKDIGKKKKSLDSMLSILGEFNVNKKVNNKYLVWTYEAYVSEDGKSDTSRKIYPKLFAAYFARNKFQLAQGAVERFNKDFPEDKKLQKELFTQILDKQINNNNPENLNSWIGKARQSKLGFSQDYIAKAEQSLGKLLFDKSKNLVKSGKLSEAITGYENLFSKENYPFKIRFNAGFSLSNLYLKVGNPLAAKNWFYKTKKMPLPKVNEKAKNHTSEISKLKLERKKLLSLGAKISQELFYNGLLGEAKSLSYKELYYVCSEDGFVNEKDLHYYNAFNLSLSQGELRTVQRLLKLGPKCGIDISRLNGHLESYYNYLITDGADSSGEFDRRDMKDFVSFFKKNENELKLFFSFERVLVRQFEIFLQNEVSENLNFLLQENFLPLKNLEVRKSIVLFINSKKKFNNQTYKLLSFDGFKVEKYLLGEEKKTLDIPNFGKEYNAFFQRKLSDSQKLIDEISEIIQKGFPEASYISYLELSKIYNQLSVEVLRVNPPHAPKEFVTSFKDSMLGVSKGFKKKSKEFEQLALKVAFSSKLKRMKLLTNKNLNNKKFLVIAE